MSPEPGGTTADPGGRSGAHELVSVGAATVHRTYEVANIPEPDGGAFAHTVSDSFGGVGANVPPTAGEFAAAAAALNCTAEGAQGGLADAETVRAFLAERGR